MSIFIFEDDVIQAQQMKRLVEEICEKHQIEFDFIEVTAKRERLIEKSSQTAYIPIYFLDIEIKNEEYKGFEVAQEIRKYDTNGIIVFVTTHAEFAPISYQYMVSALTFIDKGLPFEERYRMFEKSLLHYQARNRTNRPDDDFVVNTQHASLRVPFHSIEYIETDGPHRLALVTEDRVIYFYGTLKEVQMLDGRLFRCHQSYLVNKEKISFYDAKNKTLILKNGASVPVSRRQASKVRQILRGEPS